MPFIESPNDPALIADCRRVIVRHVQCRACGYEPPSGDTTPPRCPKCRGGCFERFVQLGKLRPAHAVPVGTEGGPDVQTNN